MQIQKHSATHTCFRVQARVEANQIIRAKLVQREQPYQEWRTKGREPAKGLHQNRHLPSGAAREWRQTPNAWPYRPLYKEREDLGLINHLNTTQIEGPSANLSELAALL